MADDGGVEHRGEPRIKKRISCELTVGERRFNGLVLDFSSQGLFVQTAAQPAPGESVHVSIRTPHRSEPLEVEARVVRVKLVPPRLRTVAQGGLGLHIEEPPPDFIQFVADVRRPLKIPKVSVLPKDQEPKRDEKKLTKERLDRFFRNRRPAPRAEPEGSSPEASRRLPRWRIQLSCTAGGGSRSFIVCCETEEGAREQARAELEDDWKIEAIDRV